MKSIKNRVLLNFHYFLMWIGYFLLARVFFLIFHFSKSKEIGFSETLKTFFYGFRLDISSVGYLTILPFLIILFSIWLPKKTITIVLKTVTYLIVFILTLLLIIDASLYDAWGIRVDSTLLTYINTPKIMLASVTTYQLIFGTVFWLVTSFFISKWFGKIIKNKTNQLEKGKLIEIPIFLFLIGFLLLPIRGGWQTIPINQSNVYFSKQMFANHTAINFAWNFGNSISQMKYYSKNPYRFFNDAIAIKIINKEKNPLLEKILF